MPFCKAAFLADVQTFYLHLYPPSRLDGGLRMSQYFGMKRDEGVSRAESAEHGDISRHWNFRFDAFNNNASYIFQGATSNISSDCRLRTYIHVTRTHIRQLLRHTGTRRKPVPVCWHLEHLPNAIRSRACTRDSDDTWVSWNLPHIHIILSSCHDDAWIYWCLCEIDTYRTAKFGH